MLPLNYTWNRPSPVHPTSPPLAQAATILSLIAAAASSLASSLIQSHLLLAFPYPGSQSKFSGTQVHREAFPVAHPENRSDQALYDLTHNHLPVECLLIFQGSIQSCFCPETFPMTSPLPSMG